MDRQHVVVIACEEEPPARDLAGLLRTLVVAGCALAMVFAGRPLPF